MKDAKFAHHVSPPDTHGVVDIYIALDVDRVTRIEGYVGPSSAVARFASEDQIEVSADRAEQRIAVLVKVHVADDRRGKGLGNELVRRFLEEASARGAEAVYLYAELSDNEFDLVAWYERRWGFRRLVPGTTEPDPMMIRVP